MVVRIPAGEPAPQSTQGIIAHIHDSANPVLLSLNNLNAFLRKIQISHRCVQQLPNTHPRSQKHQDHGPVTGGLDHREQRFDVFRVNGPGQGIGNLDAHPSFQDIGMHDLSFDEIVKKCAQGPQPGADRSGLEPPVLLVFDKGAELLSGYGLKVVCAFVFKKMQEQSYGLKIIADSTGAAVSPLKVTEILLDIHLPEKVLISEALERPVDDRALCVWLT
jgi:hypothetical protein